MQDIFKKAIELEQKGRAVYEEAAFKTRNEAVAKVFMFLAGEEKKHEEWIRKTMAEEGVELPDTTLTKEFFKMTVKEYRDKILFSEHDIAAYENALQLEKESYEYYKEQLENAQEDKLRGLFEALMEQEQSHYDMLEQSRDYLADPDLFYQRHEGWLFEG